MSEKITFANGKLHEALEAKRIHPCDVVLASNSLGFDTSDINMKRDIAIIDSLAKKRAALVGPDGAWGLYVDAWASVGQTFKRWIWSPVVLNTLWQMNIQPKVDHFEVSGKLGFDSIEHATLACGLLIKYHNEGIPLTPQETKRLHDFLEGALVLEQDGRYYSTDASVGHDLIWWDK